MKPNALAPIVVKILVARGSGNKIATDSGIKLQKKMTLFRMPFFILDFKKLLY